MKILEEAKTPQGINIILVNWNEDYPFISLAIHCYPIAKRTSKNKWIKEGESFLVQIENHNYNSLTDEQIKEIFKALQSGAESIENLANRYASEKDKYCLGLIDNY